MMKSGGGVGELVRGGTWASNVQHMIDRFLQSATESGLKVKSQAMSPILWLVGLCCTSALALVYLAPGHMSLFFCMGLIVLAAVYAVTKYEYWAKKDPDRLGSEAFVMGSRIGRFAEKSKDPSILQLGVSDLACDETPHRKPTSGGEDSQ